MGTASCLTQPSGIHCTVQSVYRFSRSLRLATAISDVARACRSKKIIVWKKCLLADGDDSTLSRTFFACRRWSPFANSLMNGFCSVMSMQSFVDCAASGLWIHGAMTLSLMAWMLMYLQGPFQRKCFLGQKTGRFVESRFQALFPSRVVVLPPLCDFIHLAAVQAVSRLLNFDSSFSANDFFLSCYFLD